MGPYSSPGGLVGTFEVLEQPAAAARRLQRSLPHAVTRAYHTYGMVVKTARLPGMPSLPWRGVGAQYLVGVGTAPNGKPKVAAL